MFIHDILTHPFRSLHQLSDIRQAVVLRCCQDAESDDLVVSLQSLSPVPQNSL